MLDTRLVGNPFDVPEDRPIGLNGHNRSINALAFSRLGLVSTSRDCTAHIWDVANRVIIRRFNHPKARMYTMSNTNETRDKYREPDMGYKNDKARHGDEQTLAITFTRFDAEPVALIYRLNRNQKEKKGNAWEFKDSRR
ncbi:hypothetical protein CK203_089681 [Vitis vinifera]|uniref:Uncharacterized protein n=1 Tax=Vitis vinifera TaxID=29760 RepID=A0A438EHX8_VITVI|nr:hypothetical protein CK203_089681 [Vitis vinifera]